MRFFSETSFCIVEQTTARLQIILYKAFWLVYNDVIKNFIGSFEKLSENEPPEN